MCLDGFPRISVGGITVPVERLEALGNTKSMSTIPSWMLGTDHEGSIDASEEPECGSYWAFSITNSLEDARLIATCNISPLCEQQLTDCDTVGSTHQDGLMDSGFDSVEKSTMYMEASHIHTTTKGTCKASRCDVGSCAIPGQSLDGMTFFWRPRVLCFHPRTKTTTSLQSDVVVEERCLCVTPPWCSLVIFFFNFQPHRT